MAGVAAGDVAAGVGDGCVDLRARVDQFFEELREGADDRENMRKRRYRCPFFSGNSVPLFRISR